MGLTLLTLRPNSTTQTGLWTVTGAANAHSALSDNTDSSYVTLIPQARLDSEILRVGFPTPSIPAGARVYSVGLRRRMQGVANQPAMVLYWYRTRRWPYYYPYYDSLHKARLVQVPLPNAPPNADVNIVISGQRPRHYRTSFTVQAPPSTTSVFVPENLGSFTVAPDGTPWDPATNLDGFELDVGRGDDFGTVLRMSEIYLDIVYQNASTVTVTGPSGSINSTRPTVTWTYASVDKQPQQKFQVAVYSSAQYGAVGFVPFVSAPTEQSGWILGEDLQWTLATDLPDGTYRAYVQVAAAWSGPGGDFATVAVYTQWTRAVATAPGPEPTLTPPPTAVLQSAVFDAVNNRVALTAVPSSSSPVTAAFTVEASQDAGVTWTPIPSLSLRAANGMTPVIGYDYVAPIGVQTRYRVQAYSLSSGQYVMAANPSNTLSVTTSGDQHWFKHPTNPLLNTPVTVAAPKTGEGIKITRQHVQGIFQRLGAAGSTALPIVVSGPNYGDVYQFELLFTTDQPDDYWPAFDQLEKSGSVLLLQWPGGTQLWGVLGAGTNNQDTEVTFDAMPGNPGSVQWRRVKCTFTPVETPLYY